jgi:uncharacterized membrane protein
LHELHSWRPRTSRQWLLPTAVGLFAAAALLALVVVTTRVQLVPQNSALLRIAGARSKTVIQVVPQDETALNASAWLQGLANAAIVLALAVTAWAALIARRNFESQRTTAQQQLVLAERQLVLANEESVRQKASDRNSRRHASMTLLLEFTAQWQADKMLRLRSQLAAGFIRKRDHKKVPATARVALLEIGNFIDRVGYCVRHDLVDVRDAWNEFSEPWEIYWAEAGALVEPSLVAQTEWENATWLIDKFKARERAGGLTLSDQGIRIFLVNESNVAVVEERVLEAALIDRPRAPRRRPPRPSTGPVTGNPLKV